MSRRTIEDVTLRAADGGAFAAAVAVGREARGAGVIVLPDAKAPRGIGVALAERFVAAGHHAIALDLAGRSSGAAPGIVAAQTVLALRTGARRCVVAGVGSGGVQALLAATDPDLELAGAIAISAPLHGVLDVAARTRVPVLAVFGGGGARVVQADVAASAAALGTAGVEHELVTYTGCLEPVEHADVWRRILEFVEPLALDRVA
jgi:dienelactone hydrolase